MPYAVFVIDPPWPQRKGGLRSVRPRQGRALCYATLSVAEVFGLLDAEVLSQAEPQHTVFIWTIDKFLRECEEQMSARGYRLHARLIWDKGNGIAPAFTVRFAHEYLLWYYKPHLTPVASKGRFLTVIRAPAREHSRKPDEAYALVAALYPDQEKIDVFSRERREGWDQFGDQTEWFR